MDMPPIHYARTEDGVNIAYTEFGDGPPLVETPMLLFNVPPALAPEDRTVYERLAEGQTFVSYDARGIGQSDPGTSWSLEAALLDLEAVIDAAGARTVSILGSGHGVPAAIVYAARHPERMAQLILFQGYLRGPDVNEQSPAAAARDVMDRDYTMWWETVMHWAGASNQDAAAYMARRIAQLVPRDAVKAFIASIDGIDVSKEAEAVQAGTLVVVRRDGRLIPPGLSREIAATIPGARLARLEGTEQLLAWGDWARVASEILDFLSEDQVAAGEETPAPGGFQTILFTDLESSTALTQRLGDEGAQELLRGHNDAVRAALEAHEGREVKHTGDGIMASFRSAVSAVRAGLAIQRSLMDAEVRVRIGINAGEPIAEDGDFFGIAVIKASRICDRAEPGQVLVSRVVADLCAGKTFEFTSVGDATLKGFDEPVALFEVRA